MSRAKLPQNHYSEEQLLAFLDGELRPHDRRAIQDHLARCWNCRGKMGDLEARAQELAALLSDSGFLGRDRVTAAKQRFLAAAQGGSTAEYRCSQFAFLSRPLLPRSLGASWLAAALVLAAFAAWTVYTSRSSTNSVQVISGAVRAEAKFLQQPVHQEFRIELVEYKPTPVAQTSELEIWSDREHNRFASRWRQQQGELQYAAWQPDFNRRFRYDQKLRKGVAVRETPRRQQESLYSVADGGPEFSTLERRVEAWISSRQWRPISMAADFSLFVNQEGALLQSKRTFSGGAPCITITATSAHQGNRLTVTLEVDSATQRPRVQEIRFQSSTGKDIAVRVAAERLEQIPATKLQAALFTPDVPIMEPLEDSLKPDRKIAAPRVTVVAALPPSPSELANAEIRIEYDLHRLGACTGESISVTKDGASGITVAGVLEDVTRKEEVSNSLLAVNLPVWVTMKLETLDEAAARAGSGNIVSALSDAVQVPRPPNVRSSTTVSVKGLPLDDYLVEYFESHPAPQQLAAQTRDGKLPADPKERAAAYSSLLVSLSQQSYRHSWAIRRLADMFGGEAHLTEESRWLLESMLRDHSRELGSAVSQIRELLDGAFHSAATAISPGVVEKDEAGTRGERWSAEAKAIFESADAINIVLFNVFASGTEAQPERAVSDLLSKLPDLQRHIEHARTWGLNDGMRRQAGLSEASDRN